MTTTTISAQAQERRGAVTFKGAPLTLIGQEVRVGAKAPEFEVIGPDLAPITLASVKGTPLLISVTPSLDTPVCDAQAKRFNEEAARRSSVTVLNVSMDLPFAQKRWCGANTVDRITTASDHRDASFGRAYGTLIKELRLLARAIFVIDGAGTVRYAEYVPELSSPPNYDAALAALRQVGG